MSSWASPALIPIAAVCAVLRLLIYAMVASLAPAPAIDRSAIAVLIGQAQRFFAFVAKAAKTPAPTPLITAQIAAKEFNYQTESYD